MHITHTKLNHYPMAKNNKKMYTIQRNTPPHTNTKVWIRKQADRQTDKQRATWNWRKFKAVAINKMKINIASLLFVVYFECRFYGKHVRACVRAY